MREVVLEMQLPPKELSPNARVYRKRKAAATKEYRDACHYQFKSWRNANRGFAFEGPVILQLEFFMGPARVPDGLATFRDTDNADASCKALQDALKLSGLIKSDDSRSLIRLPSKLHRTAAEHGGRRCILVTLKEAQQT